MRYVSMKIEAHAKVNLSLNVVRKREDGYHELEMIMVPLTLHDDVTIELSEQDQYSCDIEGLAIDESNTVVKAVKLMRETYGIKEHFHVHMEKHIPMQAGLAGGSADGAAVMKGINALLDLKIPISELSMLSKQVGADVPFCVYDTPAVVKGIGEDVTPIKSQLDFEILLVKPQEGVPTGKAFSMIDFETCEHPDYQKVQHAMETGNYKAFCESLGNTLEQPAFQIVPLIKDIKQELLVMGFDGVLMSGSGSNVFAISQDHKLIQEAYEHFHHKGFFAYQTKMIR